MGTYWSQQRGLGLWALQLTQRTWWRGGGGAGTEKFQEKKGGGVETADIQCLCR